MKNKELLLEFSLSSFEIFEQDEDISIVKLRLYHLGVNRNKCDITKESSDLSIPTFYEKPIVYRLNNKLYPKGSTDVVEHARDGDPTMMIAGIIPKDSLIEYEYDETNGKTYCVVNAIIYKVYQPTLMQILKNRNGTLKISIEMLVLDSFQQDDGILKINLFKLRGITLLGEKIPEGIEASNLEILKFAEAKKDLNKKYITFSHHEDGKYNIPENAKKDINKIFSKYKSGDFGFTEKEIVVLNSLSHKQTCTLTEANIIKSCFYNVNKNSKDKTMDIEWLNTIIENEGKTLEQNKDIKKPNILKVEKEEDFMSDKPWEKVDKTLLRNKIMEADNRASLVKDVYLKVENGWEEAPSEKLKYPVMELDGDTLVYNKNGLSSAKGYAEKENDTEVINKLKPIYKQLGLGEEKKEDEKPMEKEIENKLDKDNKDLEKIVDDADAKEDEKKAEEIKKNAIDKKAEEDLEGDVDSDEDEMEKKYACEIEAKNAQIEELQAKCNAFERKALEEKMNAIVEEYASCFPEEEMNALKEEMKNSKTEEEFSSKVFACVAKNAKKKVEEKEIAKKSFSYSIPADMGYSFKQTDFKDINALAKAYKGEK